MATDEKHQITTGQVFIGVFGTLSFFMVNTVKNSHVSLHKILSLKNRNKFMILPQISEDNSSEPGARFAKIWLLIGFVMAFASIIASIWVMIDDFINNPKKDTGRGVALLMQNVLILFANLTYKFGRDEEAWNE